MDTKDVLNLEWFQSLCSDVRNQLAQLQQDKTDRRPALGSELNELASQIAGWTVSLGNVQLPPTVRSAIETSLEKAIDRQQQIELQLNEEDALAKTVEQTLDPQAVADRLGRLDEVLAANNPSMGHVALCQHIDRIDCYRDGRVVLRTCKLGALAGAVDALRAEPAAPSSSKPVRARRRAKRRVDDADDFDWETAAFWAADPDRFAGLDECWFEEREFRIPEKSWPYQEMAIAVATKRLNGLTHEELAEKFGVTVPTIRKSLDYAAKTDERFRDLPKKIQRTRWYEDHALDVAAKQAKGYGTQELVDFFGKSDTTIRKALCHAAKILARPEPPGAA